MTYGTFTINLDAVLNPDTLAGIPAYAAERGTTAASLLHECLTDAGFDVVGVDWRGPAHPQTGDQA